MLTIAGCGTDRPQIRHHVQSLGTGPIPHLRYCYRPAVPSSDDKSYLELGRRLEQHFATFPTSDVSTISHAGFPTGWERLPLGNSTSSELCRAVNALERWIDEPDLPQAGENLRRNWRTS